MNQASGQDAGTILNISLPLGKDQSLTGPKSPNVN